MGVGVQRSRYLKKFDHIEPPYRPDHRKHDLCKRKSDPSFQGSDVGGHIDQLTASIGDPRQ